jgi:hypothetical protein
MVQNAFLEAENHKNIQRLPLLYITGYFLSFCMLFSRIFFIAIDSKNQQSLLLGRSINNLFLRVASNLYGNDTSGSFSRESIERIADA